MTIKPPIINFQPKLNLGVKIFIFNFFFCRNYVSQKSIRIIISKKMTEFNVRGKLEVVFRLDVKANNVGIVSL